MKRYIVLAFYCILGAGCLALIYGGVAFSIQPTKISGFVRILGTITMLAGCSLASFALVSLVNDNIWPAIKRMWSKPAPAQPKDPWSKPEES